MKTDLLAPVVRNLFFDSDGDWIPSRYKTMYGGRGGLKSWGFARVLVIVGAKRKLRILCGREFQNSIAESVHQVLETQIEAVGLGRYYDVQKQTIEGYNGTEFVFAGIRTNPEKIKSAEGYDIAWIEEAEKISANSWRKLIPTLRKRGSEIWVSFNPDLEEDPTSRMFIVGEPPPRARIIKTSWRDNPWLSDELREEKDYLARVDPDAYAHVWEGEFRRNSAAQILAGKCVIEAFDVPFKPADAGRPDGPKVPAWSGPYQGADWGFAVDPTTLVRCWINGRKLMIEYEAYGVGVDIDRTDRLFDQVPGAKLYQTRADNARPETISYMQRHGYPKVIGVEKWDGSVEDGIAHLRQYEQIVIHPRCVHAAQEARLYSYKIDKISGDVLPDVVDKHNHIIDAVRYALAPMIRAGNTGMLEFFRQQAEELKERERAAAQ